MKSISAWFLSICLIAVGYPAVAQDRVMPRQDQHARDLEARYANQLPPNQFRWLGAEDASFPALWIEQTTGNPQGGALIVHDDGQHPDWPRLIKDMRLHLPENGWSTLAISVPPRPSPLVPPRTTEDGETIPGSAAGSEPDPDFTPEIRRRLQTGFAELANNEGLLNVVIVGVGSGAVHAARFVVEDLQLQNIEGAGFGLVLVGAHERDTEELMDLLAEVTIPVLDVYLPGNRTRQAAQQRRAAVERNGLTTMTQVQEQPWATAHRSGPQVVTRRTWGWLRSNMAGRQDEREADQEVD